MYALRERVTGPKMIHVGILLLAPLFLGLLWYFLPLDPGRIGVVILFLLSGLYFIVLVGYLVGLLFRFIGRGVQDVYLSTVKEITKQFADELTIIKLECSSTKLGRLRWDDEKTNFIEKHIMPRVSSSLKTSFDRSLVDAEIERILEEHIKSDFQI